MMRSHHESCESPSYVRTSTAAAITMGLLPGRFFRDAKLYCINLLLTYDEGCAARCAYCGLSKSRNPNESWDRHSFIRVDWPMVALDEVISKIKSGRCPHVERVCISMITNPRARDDTVTIVKILRTVFNTISALITPTITDREWLHKIKENGADMVGIAIDAATPELFEKLRGRGVGGPHRWERYWETVEDAVNVFGKNNVGVHLIVGLGETEKEMVEVIQRAHDTGARTHLFSFFPEENSPLQNHPQPHIGKYRRVQLARYLINNGMVSTDKMSFDEAGMLRDYGLPPQALSEAIDSGVPFMTSGCPGRTMESACNRPFANCTPYQAYVGRLRNFPFPPNRRDLKGVKRQLIDYYYELEGSLNT